MRAFSKSHPNLKLTITLVRILRIIAMVPTFAVVYLLAGSIPSAAIYLQPWADMYEAVALTSYFLLLLAFIVPDPQLRDGFFDQLQQPKSNAGSLKWYHVSSATVLKPQWYRLTCSD